MPSSGSVTHWLGQLQGGDPVAAQALWERYFHRLTALADRVLGGTPRRAADQEDVALSAFASFCRGAQGGRYPQLADRDDLWRLLVVITARKALRLARRERRHDLHVSARGPDDGLQQDLEQIIGPEPTPQFALQVAEEYHRLLDLLQDSRLQTLAVWKMEGYTNREIATKLGCAVPTVERKLRRIRMIWQRELRA
ncbi:MAG: RNA polymerase subunit sigma-70 [Planctomycetes bacterium]|nr:RNA polymerase subunit sigma-70 [Planctomycetota bacterium]